MTDALMIGYGNFGKIRLGVHVYIGIADPSADAPRIVAKSDRGIIAPNVFNDLEDVVETVGQAP